MRARSGEGFKAMATIVEFPQQLREAPRAATGDNAEIVIFPGVRIERRAFSLAGRLPPARRRGRPVRATPGQVRDRLSPKISKD
jgi:hypothetical protein